MRVLLFLRALLLITEARSSYSRSTAPNPRVDIPNLRSAIANRVFLKQMTG